jgi:hypothetical protein
MKVAHPVRGPLDLFPNVFVLRCREQRCGILGIEPLPLPGRPKDFLHGPQGPRDGSQSRNLALPACKKLTETRQCF